MVCCITSYVDGQSRHCPILSSSNCALFACCFHRPQPLSEVVPRLWPFLCHSTSSVRRATLQTLRTLTTQRNVGNGMSWTAAVLQDALRHIFQRVIVEPIPEIQDLAEQVMHNCGTNP